MRTRANIPVADAPLLGRPGRAAARHDDAAAPHGAAGPQQEADDSPSWFFALLPLLTLWSFLQFFIEVGSPRVYTALVYQRYLLWPLIVVGLVIHLQRHGAAHLFRTISIVLPFFAVGIVSGVISYNPIFAARVLLFWILGVVCGAIVGGELQPAQVRRILFWFFFVTLVLSVILAIAAPGIGVMSDLRTAGGAWRGPFSGKNLLGLVCDYALVMAIFSKDVRRVYRLAAIAMAIVCLTFANSAGGTVGAVALLVFGATVSLLRRFPLTIGMRALGLIVAIGAAVAILVFIAPLLLELLGRDPTLTGRTDIWAAFLERAAAFWLTGAGPGSFTTPSGVTYDVTLSLLKWGMITNPHNMYIATFGEVGLFGLLAFVVALGYLAFVLPFSSTRPEAMPVAGFALVMIVGGVGETHEVFGTGPGMFLLILTLSSLRLAERRVPPEAEPASGPEPSPVPSAPVPTR